MNRINKNKLNHQVNLETMLNRRAKLLMENLRHCGRLLGRWKQTLLFYFFPIPFPPYLADESNAFQLVIQKTLD